ncbi:MAG: hypothetical protein Q8M92_02705 [Candidatus Subteraquimicrobiales bacterium]|nr:hypothetical protein [Candidatus Subteraquimicrobiales bacterium]
MQRRKQRPQRPATWAVKKIRTGHEGFWGNFRLDISPTFGYNKRPPGDFRKATMLPISDHIIFLKTLSGYAM